MTDDGVTSFDAERATLLRVAYRMVGSLADAEDILQDASSVGQERTGKPCAFLPPICAAW